MLLTIEAEKSEEFTRLEVPVEQNQSNYIVLQPGEFMIREKTGCDALYIVQEGQLEVYRTGHNGEKIPLGIISSGQYVGETALLLKRLHASNVVALTPVKAIRLSKASIDAQLEKVPPWLVALTRGLIERLQNTNEMMRRNGIVDESLATRIGAVEDKFKKQSTG